MPTINNPHIQLPRRVLVTRARSKQPGDGNKSGDPIRNDLNQYLAQAINQVRNRSDINAIIQTLMREDGLFSSAANSMIALASKAGYRLAGFRPDGTMDLNTTAVAYSLVDRVDTTNDYSRGYNDKQSIQGLLATLTQDTIGTGGCGVEMLLDPTRLPRQFIPVPYSSITWVSNGRGGRYPAQDNGDRSLNQPNIFIAEHNRSADEAYSVSMLRPGLTQDFQFNEFLEDTHRAINRTGHDRLISTIATQAVAEMADEETKTDPEKMRQFYETVRTGVEQQLTNLDPEDAIVGYDTVQHEIISSNNTGADYSALLSTLGNLLGVSLKTPASVSGLRSGGTQALSNAETLIYLKVVENCRPPVEEVMSRALTLAIRLLGIEGYVRFVFNPIDLRPDTELEAYRSSRQKRILEMLSYGIINTARACFELGIRPQGVMGEFSGTLFYKPTADSRQEGERESSAGGALNPDTPSSSGGGDR